MGKTVFNVSMLTDESYEGFRKFLLDHFLNSMIPLYKKIGVNIKDYSFEAENEFFNNMYFVWNIARGNINYVKPNEGYDKLEQKKYLVDQLQHDYDELITEGSIIPSSYRKTYNVLYKWHSILEFTIDLAMLRLRAYQGDMLTVSEAVVLGGFKNKESVMYDIRHNKLSYEERGPKGTYYVNSKQYIEILKEKNRLFWFNDPKPKEKVTQKQ